MQSGHEARKYSTRTVSKAQSNSRINECNTISVTGNGKVIGNIRESA